MWLIFCVTIVTVLCFRGAVRRVGNNLKTRRRPYRGRDDGVIPGRAVPTTLPVAALADGVSTGTADDSVIGRNRHPCAVTAMLSEAPLLGGLLQHKVSRWWGTVQTHR